MAVIPESSALETAFVLLSQGPLPAPELCRRVLACGPLPEPIAARLAESLLGRDQRFRRLPDGCWALLECLAPPPPLSLDRECFVVVDVETTGFAPPADRVIELGMVRLEAGRIVDEYETLIDPGRPLPAAITGLTGISAAMLRGAPAFAQVCDRFLEFMGEAVFVAHNAPFDWRFIQSELRLARGCRLLNHRLCTRSLAVRLAPELERRSLDDLAHFFNLSFEARHRALGDARVTALVLLRLLERATDRGVSHLPALLELLAARPARRRKA